MQLSELCLALAIRVVFHRVASELIMIVADCLALAISDSPVLDHVTLDHQGRARCIGGRVANRRAQSGVGIFNPLKDLQSMLCL